MAKSYFVLYALILFTGFLFAQEDTGSVLSGQVLDSLSKAAIVGAVVEFPEKNLKTQTDRDGSFRLSDIPSGSRVIRIRSLGYNETETVIDIKPGVVNLFTIELIPVFRESVESEVPFLEGQAKALNQQKTAINIKNIVSADQIGRFPDSNAAESTQRLPGVTLERDQGEGRFVQIRGTEPRLTSVSINGERIPAPEGDIRFVALDVIPADLLEAIEVSKALTADMESDAIGGAVNLVTKIPPDKVRFGFKAGGGYNNLVEDALTTFTGMAGGRFMENKLGLIVTGSYLNTDRGSDNFEPSYGEGFLEEIQLRDYLINRERLGFTSAMNYAISENSTFFLNGIFNKYDDQEFRRTVNHKVADEEIERELKDRYESQMIASINTGAKHFFSNLLQIDYNVSYSYAQEDEPDAVYSAFIQEDVIFNPNVSPDSIDPNNIQANPLNEDVNQFVLDSLIRENNLTTDRDFAAAFNFGLPFSTNGGLTGFWKWGVKYRDKKKDRDQETLEFDIEDDILLVDIQDRNYQVGDFLDGQYSPGGLFGDPTQVRGLIPSLEAEKDPESDTGDYVAKERVTGAYALAELNLSSNFVLSPGLRFEYTDTDYSAFQILFNAEGDFESKLPVSGTKSYGVVLPSIHAIYNFMPDSNLRLAFTRSLSRPNYSDLAPFELIIEEDSEIERGNPELEPTLAWNADILAEHYFETVGVVSAGFFYKRIEDNIFFFRSEEIRNGEDFDVLQPQNGAGADLVGFEVAYQNQLRFLPAPLDGLGLYANYTFADSETDLPGNRRGTLPGQAKHSGNFAVFYEKKGFSGRVSINYHGDYLSEVADIAEEDIFFDDHVQFDISVSQRVAAGTRLFAEVINLNDEPLRRYIGFENRPVQREFYSWWVTVGVNFSY